MKQRFLAAVLSLALCLGLVPANALAAEPFTPEQLGGLLAWYDAGSLEKNSEAHISKLVNQAATGEAYHAVQSTASAQPLYVAEGRVKSGAPSGAA